MADNDNEGGGGGPFCILRHGRKSHTWGTLRQAAQHTMRDPAVSWLGENIDPARTPLNEALVGSGDVVEDVRARLAAVGLSRRRDRLWPANCWFRPAMPTSPASASPVGTAIGIRIG